MQNVAESRDYKATYDHSDMLTAGITLTRKSDNVKVLITGYSPNSIFDIVAKRMKKLGCTKELAFDDFCDSKFLNK